VNHLEEGLEPPNEPCVVVTRDITGGFYVVSSEAGFHKAAPPSPNPISDVERSAAIDRATAYADQHGMRTVYVVT
jgi:hypothetical protein